MLKKIIKYFFSDAIIFFFKELKNNHSDGYSIKSYSQEGEDMILKRLFENYKSGFYIDVGAHHPMRFSNTFFFYKLGWSGINIDAMPGSMELFNKYRHKDINLEMAISNNKEILNYYAFNEPALNGFSKDLSKERDGQGGYYIKFTKDIKTSTLKDVLDKYLPENQRIDFLSIDVEGLDFMVLKSNDFNKYKPKVILIEIIEQSLENIESHEITQYLKEYGYILYAKTIYTVFFILNNIEIKEE